MRRFIIDIVLGIALVDSLGAGCALHHAVDVQPDYPTLERELVDAGADGR